MSNDKNDWLKCPHLTVHAPSPTVRYDRNCIRPSDGTYFICSICNQLQRIAAIINEPKPEE